MRYKVPQNIDLEDKVIGPLTIKQFIYLLVGGMFDYLIYSTFEHWIGWVLIVLITGIVLALAFAKVYEQEFTYFLSSFFNFITSPKLYVWEKKSQPEELPKIEKKKEEEEDELTKDPKKIKSRLQVLAEIVDTHGWKDEETGNRVTSESEPQKRLEESEEKKEGLEDPLQEVE